jgi:hypothetical protein
MGTLRIALAAILALQIAAPARAQQSVGNEEILRELRILKLAISDLQTRVERIEKQLSAAPRSSQLPASNIAPTPSAVAPAAMPSTTGLSGTARQQCAATTKKGTRCSRMAAVGAAYCWQHGR